MNKEISLTIDDKDIVAPEGMLIIEAARLAGVEIPHLCYCENLPSTGACRVCVVEVEGVNNLIASCTQKIKEGMKVITRSDKVDQARRFVLDLILSNHPGDCLSCDKNSVCELQRYAYELRIEKTSFSMKDQGYPVERDDPFIERNYNLCVLCGRCVLICKKQSEAVIDFMRRGMLTKVATATETTLAQAGCDFCGSCLSVCPTAALIEKERRFKGRSWEMATARSTCSYCGAGCQLVFDSASGQAAAARGPQMTDFICARGRFGFDFSKSDERITTPLVRKDGKLTSATYEEAIQLIASRFASVKKAHGADSIGGFIGGTESNETIYLFQKLFRAVIGTNNIDSSARLLGMPALIELEAMLSKGVLAGFDDLEKADFVIAVSSDMRAHPRLLAALRRTVAQTGKIASLGARSVDKRFTNLAILPGSEEFALAAILKALLTDETLAKKAGLVAGFKELKKTLSELDDKKIEKETTVKAADFAAVAAAYLTAKAPKIAISPEKLSLHAMELIAAILILTDNLKSSLLASLALSNLRGAAELGALAGFYPGLLKEGDDLRGVMEAFGSKLPKAPGDSIGEMLAKVGSSIFAMFVLGEDPLAHLGDKTSVKKALSSLDFLVVEDSFMTETAGLADVILPKRAALEEEGSYISYDGSLSEIHPITTSDLKETTKVLADLCEAMGRPMKYSSIKDITGELKTFMPPLDRGQAKEFNLMVANPKLQTEEPAKDYPCLLMVETGKFGFYDMSRVANSKLSHLDGDVALSIAISKVEAMNLGLSDGDEAKIKSRRAEALVKVRLDENLPPGVAAMSMANGAWTLLAHGGDDAKLKTPKYNVFAVSISKGGD